MTVFGPDVRTPSARAHPRRERRVIGTAGTHLDMNATTNELETAVAPAGYLTRTTAAAVCYHERPTNAIRRSGISPTSRR